MRQPRGHRSVAALALIIGVGVTVVHASEAEARIVVTEARDSDCASCRVPGRYELVAWRSEAALRAAAAARPVPG
jgi:hypothetical protein